MGSSGAKVVKSVKYFNEKEILDIRTPKNRHSSIEQLTENIKLEFSMRNCSSGKNTFADFAPIIIYNLLFIYSNSFFIHVSYHILGGILSLPFLSFPG